VLIAIGWALRSLAAAPATGPPNVA